MKLLATAAFLTSLICSANDSLVQDSHLISQIIETRDFVLADTENNDCDEQLNLVLNDNKLRFRLFKSTYEISYIDIDLNQVNQPEKTLKGKAQIAELGESRIKEKTTIEANNNYAKIKLSKKNKLSFIDYIGAKLLSSHLSGGRTLEDTKKSLSFHKSEEGFDVTYEISSKVYGEKTQISGTCRYLAL